MGQADMCGLSSFTPVTPFLAFEYVTCNEVLQNNVALLGTVKSSLQVGEQGKLPPHNHRTRLPRKQAVCLGRNGPYVVCGSVSCLGYFMSNKVRALT